jgi:hypothetical protein
MTLAEIVSVTGMPGLYKASGKRSDGLIATSLVDGTTKFLSGRVHLFSTLDNITIYTQEGTKELRQVLADMKAKEETHPAKALKTDEEIKAYFEAVIPDYDKEKFYASHMKKLIGWYNILDKKKLIAELTAEPTEAAAETTEEATTDLTEGTEAKKTRTVDITDKPTAKVKKDVKAKVDKPAKATSKAAGGGARKTVTPRKAS